MKILLVEDEESIREVEKAYLQRSGYTVTEAYDGQDAINKFSMDTFDLVVLDLNLPEKDGIQVCKEIRNKSTLPIIMVTARVEEIDEIIGLEIGADDYIKKPFSPNILIARVQSLLRRLGTEKLTHGALSIDPQKMLVYKDSKEIQLTTTQFNILYTLAKQPGKVFTRDEILDRAYDDILPNEVLDRTIDAHIKSIRKAIEKDAKEPQYVLTVIGKGYKFNEHL